MSVAINFKEAIETSKIKQDVLPAKTQRLIAEYDKFLAENKEENKVKTEDINETILNDIALYMAEIKSKEDEEEALKLKQQQHTPPPNPQPKKGNWWTRDWF